MYGSYLLCEAERPDCETDEGPWQWNKKDDISVGRFVAVNQPMSFDDAWNNARPESAVPLRCTSDHLKETNPV